MIDTSALIAIAISEPNRERLLRCLEAVDARFLSSVSLLEAGMILRSRVGPSGPDLLFRLVDQLGIDVISFDQFQAHMAVTAFGRFGKGMGHRAQLNFGDCAVYALAQSLNEAILATGIDFAATDLQSAAF